ncbi:hypothetical protein HDU81_004939 [Chytriomyces hyalinus]|nr:hypothetical protein HDU81_004939 [Chytriomyces hyalinus]
MNAGYSDSEVEWHLEKPIKIKPKTAQKRTATSSMIPRARKKNINTAAQPITAGNSKISVAKSAAVAADARKHQHARTDCDAVVAATPSNIKLRDEDVEFGDSDSDSEGSVATNAVLEDDRSRLVQSRTTPRCKRVEIENERTAAVKIQALFKMHRVRAGFVARRLVKIQSWWRMCVAASKHQKMKTAVNRIKAQFKQRKQKLLLQEKLAKLAKIQSRKRLLLEKRRMAAISDESSPEEMRNGDSEDSKPSQEVSGTLQPQPNPPFVNESRELNTMPLDLPEQQKTSIISPLATTSPAENSLVVEAAAPTALSSAASTQKRASRASTVTTIIPKKESVSPKSKSKPSSTVQAKPIFCHLDTLSAKELDRLTMANTSKHNGHVAVTIKTEIVQLDMERPPSPGLEPSRNLIEAEATESNDLHYGLDPKRKTRIQWNPSIRQEFPLQPASTNETSSNASAENLPKKSNLKAKPQVLKVMQVRRQTVVVKRLLYVEPEDVQLENLGFDDGFQDAGSSDGGASRVFVNKRGSGGVKRKKGAAADANEERSKKGPGRVATVSHDESAGPKKKGKRV